VGGTESPAIRRRLDTLEREAEELNRWITEARRIQDAVIAMPDESWIRSQSSDLASVLKEEPRRAATLLRRLLGTVTAERVVAPGKQRGFVRLQVRIDAASLLKEALGTTIPQCLIAASETTLASECPTLRLDLGKPTRSDLLAPQVAEMQERGLKWAEIGRLTGLSSGAAYNVWKRWTQGRPQEPREAS
jgi:hypothetical protein